MEMGNNSTTNQIYEMFNTNDETKIMKFIQQENLT